MSQDGRKLGLFIIENKGGLSDVYQRLPPLCLLYRTAHELSFWLWPLKGLICWGQHVLLWHAHLWRRPGHHQHTPERDFGDDHFFGVGQTDGHCSHRLIAKLKRTAPQGQSALSPTLRGTGSVSWSPQMTCSKEPLYTSDIMPTNAWGRWISSCALSITLCDSVPKAPLNPEMWFRNGMIHV